MEEDDDDGRPSGWRRVVEGATSRAAALFALRVTTGFLLIWWGLAKGLDTGVGQAVSETFYGGAFSIDTLLIAFGWVQVAMGGLIVLGLLRMLLLPLQFAINLFVAASVWWAILDPFWLWMGGEKPFQYPQLFYPSAIIAAASWLLIAFRGQDRWALGR